MGCLKFNGEGPIAVDMVLLHDTVVNEPDEIFLHWKGVDSALCLVAGPVESGLVRRWILVVNPSNVAFGQDHDMCVTLKYFQHSEDDSQESASLSDGSSQEIHASGSVSICTSHGPWKNVIIFTGLLLYIPVPDYFLVLDF